MGVRGPEIFDSDFAAEIRAEFEDQIAKGRSLYAAADAVMEKYSHESHDFDDGPVLAYALASLQMEHGAVSPKIRKWALTLINSGDGLERWKDAKPEDYGARKKVEQELRTKLVELG
jgi:hypothetical protein